MEEVKREAQQRKIDLAILPTAEADEKAAEVVSSRGGSEPFSP